jgi:ATP-dependent DNA ligase
MWASGHNGEIRRAALGYERRHDASVYLYAFDLIELNGDDLIRDPLEVRLALLQVVACRESS